MEELEALGLGPAVLQSLHGDHLILSALNSQLQAIAVDPPISSPNPLTTTDDQCASNSNNLPKVIYELAVSENSPIQPRLRIRYPSQQETNLVEAHAQVNANGAAILVSSGVNEQTSFPGDTSLANDSVDSQFPS